MTGKCLPCNLEDRSLIHGASAKQLGVVRTYNLTGEAREDPWACWTASLA